MPLPKQGVVLNTDDFGKCILFADTHVGYEFELMDKGVKIPIQVNKLLNKILDIYYQENAESIAILGDVKHEIPYAQESYKIVKQFIEELSKNVNNVILISGNHDGGLEKIVEKCNVKNVYVIESRGLLVKLKGEEKYAILLHGNAKPRIEDFLKANIIVMGHTHPAITLRDEIGYVHRDAIIIKLKVDKSSLLNRMYVRELKDRKIEINENEKMTIVILPTSNPLTIGVDIYKVLTSSLTQVNTILKYLVDLVTLQEIEVYLQDFTYLGTLKDLVELSEYVKVEELIDWEFL